MDGDEAMVDPFKMKVSSTWPKEKCTSIKPLAQNKVSYDQLFDYGDETTFQTKVDNSLAGQMRDCAECHVGGGGMEYVMAPKGANLDAANGGVQRLSLRDLGTGTYADGTNPITAANYTSLNYFIDQYDEDDDNVLGEVIYQDYSKTGVLEMDCLMCHMDGYSWSDRKDAIRKGKFDSSRSAGAGLGVVAGTDGITVTYDAFNVVDDGNGNAILAAPVLDAIKGSPPSANCSSCHFDMHQVDWKKRGTSWNANMAHDTEVHASIGCVGCHERTDGIDMDPNNSDPLAVNGAAGNWTGNAAGAGKDVLGHDPSKQFAPYSSLWNANDGKGGAKTCESCHTDSSHSAYGDFGAVDPTSRHTELGLLSQFAQNGRDGVQDASHLDIIACDACHTRKLGRGPTAAQGGNTHGSLYEWGTGGALVDSTGVDTEGRLTDHESLYVERTMENNLVRGWSGGKLSSRHGLVTMFYRDKDDLFNYGNGPTGANDYVDINADGQTGAMDAVNPSHVRDAMDRAGLHVLTHDGVVDDAEIDAQIAALKDYLPDVGIDVTGAKLKLSFMGVLFRANHGTSPASQAWGANGCADCHADGAGFYNGSYDLAPRDLDASWTNKLPATDDSAVGGKKPKWKYVVPFTKVNKANYSGRDVTLPICSSYYGPDPRPAAPAVGTLADIGNACSNPDTGAAGTWTVYPLGDIKADWMFTDFHPTLWAKGMTSRSVAITAAHGASNGIRTIDRSELLYNKDETVDKGLGARTMVDGTVAGGRTAIVDNLNTVANFNLAVHTNHLGMLGDTSLSLTNPNCVACHDNANPINSGIVDSGTFTEAFAYDGSYNCTTACHDPNGVGTNPTDVGEVQVVAHFSALASDDTDLTVTYDASRATCVKWETEGNYQELTCDYAWDVSGGTVVGGSATADTVVVQYPDAGDYTATLVMSNGSVTDTQTVTVTAGVVEAPASTAVLTSTPHADGTCTVQGQPGNAVRAYIYWGNRTSTVVTAADLTNGVTEECGANVRVKVYDDEHNAENLVL